jgi:hypothetical protein
MVMGKPRFNLAGSFFSFLLWAMSSSVSLAEVPADIQLLREVSEITAKGVPSEATVQEHAEKLISLVLEQVDSIAKARGYPDWFSSDNRLIVSQVRAIIRSGATDARLKRLTVNAVSGRLAEDAMALAAGAPDLPSAKHSVPVSLGSSASATGGGALALSLDDSSIQGDKGSIGSGNGALDAGEFARLNLVFKNVSSSRLMSTSIYLASMSECLWSPDDFSEEEELPELMPGESTTLAFKIYLSGACKSRNAALVFHAFDSHAFSRAPLVFRIVFPAVDIGGASVLTRVRIDSDDYGFSEPSQARPIQPKDQVELSAGLRISGSGWSSVHQVFTVPSPLESTHEDAPTRPSYSSSTGTSTASVVDDVDIAVPAKASLQSGLKKWARIHGWKTPEDAKLFVAVDSLVTRGAEPTSAARSSASLAQSEGETRVNRAKVERVLREHVGVEPVVRRGSGGEGIPLVTVDGFRVYVEDPDALMSALEGIAPSAARTPVATQTAGKKAPVRGSTSYQVRHYIELPIAWTAQAPVAPPPPASCTCSIRGPATATTVKKQATLEAAVFNCSPDAGIVILLGKEKYSPYEYRSGYHLQKVSEDKPGSYQAELLVITGIDVECSDRTTVKFTSPPSPDKYTLRWSIEPRYGRSKLDEDPLNGFGLLASVGKTTDLCLGLRGQLRRTDQGGRRATQPRARQNTTPWYPINFRGRWLDTDTPCRTSRRRTVPTLNFPFRCCLEFLRFVSTAKFWGLRWRAVRSCCGRACNLPCTPKPWVHL